jgi:hypothetical protein
MESQPDKWTITRLIEAAGMSGEQWRNLASRASKAGHAKENGLPYNASDLQYAYLFYH